MHKKMWAVEVERDFHFERLKLGTSPVQLRALAEWLVECEVEEVVMESTAQYWRPVRAALERYWKPKRRTPPMRALYPARRTLHKRNRIGEPAGESETFPTRNVW